MILSACAARARAGPRGAARRPQGSAMAAPEEEPTPKQRQWLEHRATPEQLATFRETGVRQPPPSRTLAHPSFTPRRDSQATGGRSTPVAYLFHQGACGWLH
jgi:hypothetical protein